MYLALPETKGKSLEEIGEVWLSPAERNARLACDQDAPLMQITENDERAPII